MRISITGLAILGLILPATSWAQEAETQILEPSSSWHLDYHADKCRLARTFGEDDTRTVLLIEQFAPSAYFSWIAAGDPLQGFKDHKKVLVHWGPGHEPFEIEFMDANLPNFGPAILGIGFRRSQAEESSRSVEDASVGEEKASSQPSESLYGEPSFEPKEADRFRGLRAEDGASIQAFSLSQENRKVALAIGDMKATFGAMNACMANLVASWGLDPKALETQEIGPKPLNMEKLAREIQHSYPRSALNKGTQANFRLRIIVDEAGEPTDCRWVNVTAAEGFEGKNSPCRIVSQYAKFEPARNGDGKPLRSYYFTSINYRIH